MSAATLCFWQNSTTAAASTNSMPDSTTSPTSNMTLTPESPTLQINKPNKGITINNNNSNNNSQLRSHLQNKNINNSSNNNYNNMFKYRHNKNGDDWEMQSNGLSQHNTHHNSSNNNIIKKNNNIIVLDDKQQRDQHNRNVGLSNSVRLIGGHVDANDVSEEGVNVGAAAGGSDVVDGLGAYCEAEDDDRNANIDFF